MNIIYSMPLNFEERAYSSTKFTFDGFEFTVTLYENRVDKGIYIDIYDDILGEGIVEGMRCIPNFPLCDERDYMKDAQFRFFINNIKEDFGKYDLTKENINEHELVMVVYDD